MSMLLFFPWYEVREPQRLPGFELLPFRTSDRPGADATQARIDRILSCYRDAAGRPVRRASLLRVGSHELLDELTDDEQDSAAEFSQVLATAGLAGRTYFEQFGYCNADAFTLVVQRFVMEPDNIAPRTRRRDGWSTNVWPVEDYRVLRPPHVLSALNLQVDWELLRSLLRARSQPDPDVYLDSLVGYNLANSDSDRVSLHSEMVLLVGALQRLLQCGSAKETEFVAAVGSALRPRQSLPPEARTRIAEDEVLRRRHERDATLCEAWAKDLYRSRGNPAHGKLTHGYKASWLVEEHLLLASFLFPRLLKQRLADARLYVMAERDIHEIDKFEALAAAEHFIRERQDGWPWTRILASE